MFFLVINLSLTVVFLKLFFLERGCSPDFCDYLHFHKLRFFWKFYLNSSTRSESMKINFLNFSYFSTLPSLKKLKRLAYNRWCHQFLVLPYSRSVVSQIYQVILIVLSSSLWNMKGSQIDNNPRKNYLQKGQLY